MIVNRTCAILLTCLVSHLNLACQSDSYSVSQMHGRFEAFQDHSTPDLTLEYRAETKERTLQTVLGASLFDEANCSTHCGNYLFTGVRYPIPMEGPVDAGVGLAFGSYHSGGIDLGSAMIARPGFDVSIPLGNAVRLGGYLHHFTSAVWGEDDPGAESVGLQLNWSF